MQTVNLKFPTREKVNKKTSQAVDKFYAGSQNNPVLESALSNVVYNMEQLINVSSRQLLGRLSSL